jgi:hypothetical protein
MGDEMFGKILKGMLGDSDFRSAMSPATTGPYTHTFEPCRLCLLTEDEGWEPHEHPALTVEEIVP